MSETRPFWALDHQPRRARKKASGQEVDAQVIHVCSNVLQATLSSAGAAKTLKSLVGFWISRNATKIVRARMF